jgi:murein DD-endopeptidase MepM/ murein hydrolase activator NlpD
MERLEDRVVLASLQIQTALLVNSAGLAITAPAIGEQVFIEAKWITSGLTTTEAYYVDFTVDGVTLQSGEFTGQTGQSLAFSTVVGGWFAAPGSHTATVVVDPTQSVAGADESHTSETFSFVPLPPTTLSGEFLDPMGVQQPDWTVADYVDVNPTAGQPQDFAGGPYTFAGNTAMDFALGNFGQMDAGYPVVAALGGMVVSVQDGEYDRNTAPGNNLANFVQIDDGNGWQTVYSDFMANSIAVALGDTVAPGQVLGLVGSSGNSTNPQLAFEVLHNGDVVETNFAPSAYWASPLPYEETVPPYVVASGITSYDPSADLEEGPVPNSVFPISVNTPVFYCYKLSHLDPTDPVTVNWYQPNGALAASTTNSPVTSQIDAFAESSLSSTVWSTVPGTWQVQLMVDNQVTSTSSFTVTGATSVPLLRVTQGSGGTGIYIPNGQTTPVNFGSVPLTFAGPELTFNLQNIGRSQLNLSNLALPPGFSLVGSFRNSIAVGSSANLTVQMNTNSVGPLFGQLSFATSGGTTSTYAFNITGNVTGSISSGAPMVTLPSPAAVYDPRFGPVAVDPAAVVTDDVPQTFASGELIVHFASGGTSTDQLGVANQGNGPQEVSTNGTSVLYGGTPVGTFAGGGGSTPLVVTFNAASTLAAVQAVARDITFVAGAPASLGPRYVGMSVVDSQGAVSTTAVKTLEVDPDLVPPDSHVALTSSLVQLVYGQSATLTANVTDLTTGTLPSGTVTFENGGFVLGVVTLSNGLAALTIGTVGAGTDTITAIYSGNTVDTASSASLTLTVSKANLTLTADNQSKYEGTPNAVLTATITGFVGSDTAAVLAGAPSLSTTATLASGVGIYPIIVGVGTLSAANYNITTLINGNYAVNSPGPAGITITSLNVAPTYGQTLTFMTNVEAMVEPAATPTGTVQFQLEGADIGSPVALAGGVAQSISIPTLGAGNYTVSVQYSGDAIYPSGTGTLILAVAKAPLIVEANSVSITYGSPLPTLSASITGFVNGDTAAVVNGAPVLATTATATSAVGLYPITVARGTLSAVNYSFPNLESGFLSVIPAKLTVTAIPVTSPYGGPLPTFGWTVTGFRNGDSAAVVTGTPGLSTTATTASPVGNNYQIIITAGTLAAANYTFSSFVNGTLTITPAHLTVTANSVSTTYGSVPGPLTATITGFVNGDTASVISGVPSLGTLATSASGTGNYPITVSLGTLSAANYNFTSFKPGTLTITKAHLTVTAEPGSTLYGAPLPSITVAISGFVGKDNAGVVSGTASAATTATQFSPVGMYPITVSAGTLSAANYDFTNLVDGTLTVNKAHLTVTPNPATSVYGGPIPPLSATISGFRNGDGPGVVSGSPVVSTAATPASPVGTYPINASAGTLTAANYDFTNLVTGTLTISQAPLTVTANDEASYLGAAIPPFTATITGFVNGDTPAVVTGSPTFFSPASPSSPLGSYSIFVGVGTLTAANYNFPNLVGGTLNIVPPGGVVVSVSSSNPAPTYGEALQFTTTVSPITSGAVTPTGMVQFQIDTDNVGLPVPLVDGAATSPLVAPLPAGTHQVSVLYSGDEVYGSTAGSRSLMVNKAHLTVTASPATGVYGGPISPLGASLSGFVNGDSAAVVSGQAALATTATPASGVGNFPITVGAGTLSATNYDFTNLVGSLYSVTPAPLVVTANFTAKVTGAVDPPLTATISGFVNDDTAEVISGSPTLSTTATTSSPPGIYPISVGLGTLSAANYVFATFQSGTLAVVLPGSTDVSIVSSNPNPTYGQSLSFSATVSPGAGSLTTPTGSVQFEVDGTNLGAPVQLAGGTAKSPSIATLGAGAHTVTAVYFGDTVYPPNSGVGNFVVAKAPLTVTAGSEFSTYGAPIPVLSASITGFVGGDTAAVVSGAPSLSTTATVTSGAGTYPITVSLGTLAAANYEFTNLIGSTFTVAKANLAVVASTVSTTYGSPLPALDVMISGFVNGDTASVVSGTPGVSTTATPSSGVGRYPITVGPGTLSAANYLFTNMVSGTLVVNPAPLTVTANSPTITYGDAVPPPTATISGFVNGDTTAVVSGAPTLSGTATSSSGAGIYPITIGPGTMVAANYDFTNLVNGVLTINPAPLTITAQPASSTYGGPLPSLGATISGFVKGDSPSVVSGRPLLSTTAMATSSAGTYPITVGVGTLSATNYDFTNLVGANLTIAQVHLTVTASPATSTYGAPLPAFSVTFSGFVNGDTSSAVTGAASLTTSATATSGAGVYPISAGLGTLAAVNYDFTNFVGSNLTVSKAPLTITADSASITYGNALPALRATISGFVNGDTLNVVTGAPSLSTTATGSSGAGAYPVTVSPGTLAAANYVFSNLVAGTLTINKAPLTVSAGAVSLTYGDPIPGLSATISGFVNGDTATVVSGMPSLSSTATASSGAGTYPIEVAVGTLAAANYAFVNFVSSNLTISKAHLTVMANDASASFGAALPPLDATLSGFVKGDTPAVVTGTPALSTTATSGSDTGAYPISVGIGTLSAVNYDFPTLVGGTLTVLPVAATLNLSSLNFTYDGLAHPATLSTDPANLAGVTVTYTLGGVPVTTPTSAGSYQVVGMLNNPNYAAPAISATLIIHPAPTTLTWANPTGVGTGSALGPAQLDATASVPGTITYSPPSGTILNSAGPQVLSATFIPSDTTDYLPATSQVTVNVSANENGNQSGPAIVQFGAAEFDGNASSGMASVVVTRSGNTSTAVSVNVATTGGNATPGVDYTPVATTLYFSPGETSTTVAVPIENNPGSTKALDVGLVLGTPGAGAEIGNLSLASLVIHDSVPVSPVTLAGVHLAKVKTTKHKTATVIVVQFSGVLDPASADNLANFSLVSAGKGNNFGTRGARSVTLTQATYNASVHTVTLTTRKPLVLTTQMQLRINAAGLSDGQGRPLSTSNTGQSGGSFTAVLSKRGVTIA